MGDIAIKVENLTKEYRLGTIGHGTLREDMQSAWARLRGKEDPNSLISAKHNVESDNKHFLALENLNFEIIKGDRVGIIGKNGAGKSTLLKILSKVTSPTKGNLYIDGRIGSLLEVGTGFHPELTGRENIYLNGAIMGMKKWEIAKKFEEIVDFSGVEKFIDTPIKRYSSGMFVRLGFAVAAHLEPEILVVDEVLAVGDAEFQKKAIRKMEAISNNDGRTILFVSHNMAMIRKLCNNGILLKNGSIETSGNISNVIDKYMSFETKNEYKIKDSLIYDNVYIEKVVITNRNYIQSQIFSMTEEILVNCQICIKENANITFSVQIKELDDTAIIHLPNMDCDFPLPSEPGKHNIRINIPSFNLYPGEYKLRCALTDIKTGKQEEVDDLKLVIEQDYQLCHRPLPRQAGLIFLKPKWELIETEEKQ